MKRTRWTAEKISDFTEWHERRMKENGYGTDVLRALRRDRSRFLSSVSPTSKTAARDA